MHVQVFESEKGGYGLTEDDTGAALPADRGPWTKTASMELSGPASVEMCAAISQDGYYLTDTLAALEGGGPDSEGG